MLIWSYIKQNKVLSLLLTLQCLFLIWMLAFSFAKPLDVRYSSDDFMYDSGLVEISDEGDAVVTDEYNEGEEYDILSTDTLSISPGAYEITVEYHTQRNPVLDSKLQPTYIGLIEIYTQQETIVSKTISLRDGQTSVSSRMWLPFPFHADDFEIVAHYNAYGNLYIRSITIQELPIWRATRLLTWLLLFGAIDTLLLFIFGNHVGKVKRKDRMPILFGIMVVVLTTLPIWTNVLIWGDDLLFHIERITYYSNALFGGQVPTRILTDQLYGYGYVSPLFYSSLFLTLPAILYKMAVPIQACYKIYVLFIATLTYSIAQYAFSHMLRNKRDGLLGAALYSLSSYHLLCLFRRAAVGEYTAMAFLPLILYGVYQIYTHTDTHDYNFADIAPLVLGVSGVIQSHVLSVLMVLCFLVPLAIIHIRKTLQPKRLLALLRALCWIVVLNLWFLLPFLQSLRMSLYINASDVPMKIQDAGLSLLELLSGSFAGITKYATYIAGFTLGMPIVLGIALYLLIFSRKDAWGLTQQKPYWHLGMLACGFSVVAIWLSTNTFPWDALAMTGGKLAHLLCTIQFPWRFLTLATLLGVLTTLIAIRWIRTRYGEKTSLAISGALLLITIVVAGSTLLDIVMVSSRGFYLSTADVVQNTIMSAEYLPEDSVLGSYPTDLVTGSDLVTTDSYVRAANGDITLQCSNLSSEETSITLPVYLYDNYHAYAMPTSQPLTIKAGNNSCIQITIPAGFSGDILVRYEPPVLWRISEVISVLAIAAFLFLLFRSNKNKRIESKEIVIMENTV